MKPGIRVSAIAMLAIFFVSGAAALIYQTIWQRVLTLFGGGDVVAVTIVVAAFMAGMGFGHLAGGHLADRLAGPWRLPAFAVCEFAVALFALVSTTIYYDILYARFGALTISRFALGTVVFLVTLWPTFFMGMSLPLAVRALTDDARQPARWVPLLYGWNTLGAACGSLAAVAVVLRTMDFPGGLQVGAVLSGICGVAALAIAPFIRQAPLETAGESLEEHPADVAYDPPSHLNFGAWVAVYGLSGFVALSLEIVWFRVLGIVLKSNSLTFGHLLAVYLGGIGLGSLMARLPFVQRWRAGRVVFLLQAAVPIYAGAAVAVFVVLLSNGPLLATLREYLAGTEPFAMSDVRSNTGLFLLTYVVVPIALIGPPTVFMGLTFGFLQRAVQTDLRVLGRRLGWLQTANIIGAVIGALATGLVFMDGFGTIGTLRVLVGCGFVFVFVHWRTSREDRRWSLAFAAGATVVLIALPAPATFWARLHGSQPGATLSAEDASGLSLLKSADLGRGPVMVYANGLGQGGIPYGNIHTALAALPLMLHPNPTSIAIIGLGSGDTSFSAAGRPETREIESIELVGAQVVTLGGLNRLLGYPALRVLLSEPRIRHIVADGRVHLRRADRRYDLIEADALRPRSAYSGNLYSVEYFQLLRDRLKPGGFAVTWIPTDRVRDTMLVVFPYVTDFQGIAIGSLTPIPVDAGLVRSRLRHPFTQQHYAAANMDIERLLTGYLDSEPISYGPDFDRARLTDVNRDLFPKDEFAVAYSGHAGAGAAAAP